VRWTRTIVQAMLRLMEPLMGFVGVAAIAMLIPGPDTFVVLRAAVAHGPHAGRRAAAGSAAGNLVWGSATVAGVAGLLATSAAAFSALKLAGAAYLVVLGWRALYAAWRGDLLAHDDAAAPGSKSDWVIFRSGLTSDLLNVKVGLFWTALVPQFVTAGTSPLLPVAMIVTMGAIAFGWLAGYAYLAARLSRRLRRRGTARAVNAGLGVMLVALGGGLAFEGA
jgi:threonine/homoserine/homoserine lactone efflux protein